MRESAVSKMRGRFKDTIIRRRKFSKDFEGKVITGLQPLSRVDVFVELTAEEIEKFEEVKATAASQMYVLLLRARRNELRRIWFRHSFRRSKLPDPTKLPTRVSRQTCFRCAVEGDFPRTDVFQRISSVHWALGICGQEPQRSRLHKQRALGTYAVVQG